MSCSGCAVREITSAEFLQELRRAPSPEPAGPLTASMDWTARCNLRCRHCFVRSSGTAEAEMDTRRAREALDRLASGGVLFLVVTGGEPLLRPDFRELYRHARSLGFVLTLFTNGTLIDAGAADFLAANPPRRVEVSVYGATPATCAAVTGDGDAFRRARRGVDELLRRGVRVRLKTMVLTLNAHELADLQAWAASLGCEFRYDALVHSRLDGDRGPTALRLPPAEAVRLQFSQPADRAEFEEYLRRLGPELPPRATLLECGAGLTTLHVDAAGRAHPCMLWRRDPFDLAAHGLGAAWAAHLRRVRDQPPPAGECVACRDRGLCSACAPLSLLETGSPSAAVPFHCRLAAERKRQCGPDARN